MRIFLAIELPDHIKKYLTSIQHYFSQTDIIEARYVPKEQLHITLHFFQNLNEEQVYVMCERLENLTYQPFRICLDSLQLIPSNRFARLLWIHVMSHEFEHLFRVLNGLLCDITPFEKRPFIGHCTLLRIKKIIDYKKLEYLLDSITLERHCFVVDHIVIKESIITDHAEHKIIKKISFVK